MSLKKVALTTIGNGAATELFEREMDLVLKNIADPNTPATEVRKIYLEVSIKPTDDRDMGVVLIRVDSKLSGVKGVATAVYIGKEGGKDVAYENNPKQPELPFSGTVVQMEPAHA